jgi:hypothetical protein
MSTSPDGVDELRAVYNRLYKFITDEARWRDRVFADDHPQREAKLAAVNQALQDLITLKDEAKAELQSAQRAPAARQLMLIDTPAPYNVR